MRLNKFILLQILLLSLISGFSQDMHKEKYEEHGYYFGFGGSSVINVNDYYKNKFGWLYEFGPYNRIFRPEKKLSFKYEGIFRGYSNSIQFADNIEGIVVQYTMGLGFKGIYNKFLNKNEHFELAIGPSIHIVGQDRIPNPNDTNEKKIRDGIFAYCVTSIEIEFSYTIPLENGHFGMATRWFYQPQFTIFSQKNVPHFYLNGYSIAWFFSF